MTRRPDAGDPRVRRGECSPSMTMRPPTTGRCTRCGWTRPRSMATSGGWCACMTTPPFYFLSVEPGGTGPSTSRPAATTSGCARWSGSRMYRIWRAAPRARSSLLIPLQDPDQPNDLRPVGRADVQIRSRSGRCPGWRRNSMTTANPVPLPVDAPPVPDGRRPGHQGSGSSTKPICVRCWTPPTPRCGHMPSAPPPHVRNRVCAECPDGRPRKRIDVNMRVRARSCGRVDIRHGRVRRRPAASNSGRKSVSRAARTWCPGRRPSGPARIDRKRHGCRLSSSFGAIPDTVRILNELNVLRDQQVEGRLVDPILQRDQATRPRPGRGPSRSGTSANRTTGTTRCRGLRVLDVFGRSPPGSTDRK